MLGEMRRGLFIGIAVVVVVAFLALFYFGAGQPASGGITGGDPAEGAVHIFGEDSAPVEIVEFSNYLCAHCQNHALNMLSSLMSEYVEKGQVRYIFRDFPFTGQANVIRAGEAAACAGDQDAYVDYHILLFRDMQGWGGLGLEALNQRFTNYAQQLGLDPEVFTSCLESGDKRGQVLADQEYGATLGINSTPTFFINGEMNVGTHPIEWWEEKISQAIAAQASADQ